MDLWFREATIEDADKMRILFEQLGYPQSVEATESGIKECEKKPDYKILLVFNGEDLAGLITMYIIHQFFVPTKKCHVEALIIDPNYKRKGLGKILLGKAEEYAISQECKMVELFSGEARAIEGTHDFYKMLGYDNTGPKAVKYFKKYLLANDLL